MAWETGEASLDGGGVGGAWPPTPGAAGKNLILRNLRSSFSSAKIPFPPLSPLFYISFSGFNLNATSHFFSHSPPLFSFLSLFPLSLTYYRLVLLQCHQQSPCPRCLPRAPSCPWRSAANPSMCRPSWRSSLRWRSIDEPISKMTMRSVAIYNF